VTATSFGALCNQLGIAVGFYIPPAVVRGDGTRLPLLMAVEVRARASRCAGRVGSYGARAQAAIAAAAGLLILLFFRSEPPTPPSASAATRREHHDEARGGAATHRRCARRARAR
jgi:hypothetical protein